MLPTMPPITAAPALRQTLAALLLAGVSATALAAPCTDTIDTSAAVLSTGFGFNTSNTRNQPSPINAGNVASLKVAYTQVADGSSEKRGAAGVTQQTVYYSEGNTLVAANRATGCEYWRFKGLSKSSLLGANAMRSSSVYYLPPADGKKAMVFGGDFFGNVYALDAQNGQQVWRAQMSVPADDRHFITGSPQVYQGTMYLPVASKEVVSTLLYPLEACCKSHGMLHALDPYTGKIKWTYHTATSTAYYASTNSRGPNGMSIWGTPAIDVANKAVLIGTGQHFSPPTTGNSNAIISLDMATGAVRWVFQSTAGDVFNFACLAPASLDARCRIDGPDVDFGAPPIVAALPGGGTAVIAGAKNGVVYSLNPATGAVNWQQRIGVGGNLGGVHWGMAVDARRVYAGVTDLSIHKIKSIALADLSNPYALLGKNIGLNTDAAPGVYALDLRTGQRVWERHFTHLFEGVAYPSLYSAGLTVTNDVLLAGSMDGELKALRTSDGAELWSYQTAAPVTGVNGKAGQGGSIDSAGPVVAGGDVLINSGYLFSGGHTAYTGGPGNALYVFRLP